MFISESHNIADIKLRKHKQKELTEVKLLSLSKKYFSIPKQYHYFYPKPPNIKDGDYKGDSEDDVDGIKNVDRKRRKQKVVGTASSKIQKVSSDELPKKAPPGRPKKTSLFMNINLVNPFFRFSIEVMPMKDLLLSP